MRYLGYSLVLLLLSGCMSIEDRRSLMMGNAKKNCSDMGFKEGTQEHSNCQLELIKAAVGGGRVVAAPSQAPAQQTARCVPVGSGVNCY